MRQRHQLDLEGSRLESAGERDLDDRHLSRDIRIVQLAAQHRGREGRGPDRSAEPLPEIGHGAEMILMRMGQNQADEILSPLLDEARIGHDDLDPRRRLVAEADAEIDHQPFPGMSVKVQVHADLPRPAQGQEEQLVGTGTSVARHLGSQAGEGNGCGEIVKFEDDEHGCPRMNTDERNLKGLHSCPFTYVRVHPCFF